MENILELASRYSDEMSALTTIAAVIISFISLFVAVWAIIGQRKYENAGIRPVAHIFMGDFPDRAFVGLKNVGVGPMIVTKIEFQDQTGKRGATLVSLMPDLTDEIKWKSYSTDLTGHAFGVNDVMEFVHLEGDKDNKYYQKNRAQIRQTLAGCSVDVRYQDLLGRSFECSKSLDWFGRDSPNRSL